MNMQADSRPVSARALLAVIHARRVRTPRHPANAATPPTQPPRRIYHHKYIVALKILETSRAYRTLYFHQEKGFQDLPAHHREE
jgi:hypothetical protein